MHVTSLHSFGFGRLSYVQFTFFQLILSVLLSSSDTFDCGGFKLFEGKIDLCNLTEKSIRSSFLSIFIKSFLKSADFELKCPFRAGVYTVSNYTFSVVPRMPFPANVRLCTIEKYFMKTSDKKSMRLIATINGHISYEA
jgi:Protein of unknown function (DUF1091)